MFCFVFISHDLIFILSPFTSLGPNDIVFVLRVELQTYLRYNQKFLRERAPQKYFYISTISQKGILLLRITAILIAVIVHYQE